MAFFCVGFLCDLHCLLYLVALGYFLGLSKSILRPRQAVPYLGFMVDSVKQAFLLLHDKKQKFCDLICLVLGSDSIDLKTLQRLSGKCTSFALAVPGARLFTNEINLAISKATRSSRPVTLSGPLKVEIASWTFLESWECFLPWRSEFHRQIVLCCDASAFAWGAVLNPNAKSVAIRDYWPSSQSSLGINCKEILALCNALKSFSSTVSNGWVDVFTDSQVLLRAWRRQGLG